MTRSLRPLVAVTARIATACWLALPAATAQASTSVPCNTASLIQAITAANANPVNRADDGRRKARPLQQQDVGALPRRRGHDQKPHTASLRNPTR